MEEKNSVLEVDPEEKDTGRSKRLASLFAAAILVVSTGCSDDEARCTDKDKDNYCDKETCVDKDEDGYCDNGDGRVGGSAFYKNGKKVFKKISGISSGSKGGVGSSSRHSSGG
ncbi:hypothetical protein SAMN05444487_103169 [Marininema mesophilum]|uniref:Uncharacterized protein n=1 Tax=Marininema mesophilum TaxID=1048340 RepID=A0A1H2TL13_9BACL|nr:hypothetical protein [Marininema mesophilum]SDW44552.1 hypothetical protein SAMN05444487_103169 [Marininema mesophilum]